jgi:hypothetical protein
MQCKACRKELYWWEKKGLMITYVQKANKLLFAGGICACASFPMIYE